MTYRDRSDHDPYERDAYGRAETYPPRDRSRRGDSGYGGQGGYGGSGSYGDQGGYGDQRGGYGDGDQRGYRGYGDQRGGYGDQRGYGGSGDGYRRDYEDPDEGTSWGAKLRQKRKDMPLWQELPLLLIVAFCLAVLVRTFLVQAFFIPSGSMEPKLLVGDRVLVNKIVYDVRQPERGEIVVFRGTDNWAPENAVDNNVGFFAKLGRTVGDLVGVSQPGEKDFIKRVIGLPGDTVACCNARGQVTVNGYPLTEPYVQENSPLDVPPNPQECHSRRFGPVTVEQGQMFVMGDHRLVSQDARCEGAVPIANVIGRAFVIVWPSSRWTALDVPSTFANVPKPFAEAGRAPVPHPVPSDGVPEAVLVVPILASSVFTARSRRRRRGSRRKLLG